MTIKDTDGIIKLTERAAPAADTAGVGQITVINETPNAAVFTGDTGVTHRLHSTLGTEITTTGGTAIDFTGIPSGVKEIKVMFAGISTTGTSNIIIQLGDSGGIETSGYVTSAGLLQTSANSAAAFSNGWNITKPTDISYNYHGFILLVLQNSATFTWEGNHQVSGTSVNFIIGTGGKSLSAELTQIRITTAGGSDTFDVNGGVSIQYS